MHRSRIRLLGGWIDLSVLTAAEVELLDAGNFAAVDGDAGGAWAPASAIVIGGLGMWVTGLLKAEDLLIHAGAQARFDGAAGNLAYLRMRAYSLLEVRANAGAAILAGAVLDIYGDCNVQPGSVFNVLSASGLLAAASIQWNDGTDANFLDGAKIILNDGAELISSGTAYMNGLTKFQQASATVVLGVSGAPAIWTFGAYTATTVEGTSGGGAAWNFGEHSTTTWVTNALAVDGAVWLRSGIETWSGADKGPTFATGTKTLWQSGAKVILDAGVVLQQNADNARTGADIPSGTGAVSALRPGTGGPSTNMVIDMAEHDFIRLPTGLTGTLGYHLTASRPCRTTIISWSAAAQLEDVLVIYDSPVLGNTLLATFNPTGVKQSSCTFASDGDFITVVGSSGSVTLP